ncbi:MAG: type II toxin-antitoxin system HicA family toxin [Acidobacteria bacterium]|nr:type II toxin-antitoxin system HicA family toxin [Acidobacteriota bacterium]
MARSERTRKNVLGGTSDANIRRPGVAERVNLQRDGSHAKPYQVRQVRRILLKYGLTGEE